MRRVLVVAAAVAAGVVLGGGLVWLILPSAPTPAAPTASPPPSAAPAVPDCRAQWAPAGFGAPVPSSPCAGPHWAHDGLAGGFSQDRTGAEFAAIHLSTRLTSASGPTVYAPTLAGQTIGDYQQALGQTQQETSTTPPSQSMPRQWWARVSGNPASGVVTVDLAAATDESRSLGGFAGMTATLRWQDGDWKVVLPKQNPQLVTSTAGYELLGPAGGA